MIAKLHIETALRGHKTILKQCFCTPPFKVLDVTEDKNSTTLHLMLMNASPGVLDGDAYSLNVNIAKGCSLQLHTQSYQRLFRMQSGAVQCMEINMEADSALYYVPHPCVPHAAANFVSKTKIRLAENGTLLWGDVLTCGRKSSGERFSFSRYHSVTEIFLHNRLLVKENVLLQPALFDITALGQLENYTHQASLIFLNEEVCVPPLANRLHDMLSFENGICFGITTLPVNGFLVRLLGYKGEQLYGILKKLEAELTAATCMRQQPCIENRRYAN
jgi:urease accessory protein